MHVLMTDTAGFIGFHLARLLLDEGDEVHGYDAMTDYYDEPFKQRRHALLTQSPGFTVTEARLEDESRLREVAPSFRREGVPACVNWYRNDYGA